MSYLYDEPFGDHLEEPDWDHMLHILDGAGSFPGFDAVDVPSYAVLRVIFQNTRPDWRVLGAGRPAVLRTSTLAVAGPFSYADSDRRSVLLWDSPGGNALDIVTWQGQDDPAHGSSHPEARAVEWLQNRQRADPYFGRRVMRIKLLIQDTPCKSCLNGLRASLGQVMPAGTSADVQWVRPRPQNQFRFFRDRRYQPRINRWSRD